MTETVKERIYLEALEKINNLAIDVAMDYEETGVDSVDCGKLIEIVNKAFFSETNQQPIGTEKLEKKLATAVEALKEISKEKIPFRNGCFYGEETSEGALKAKQALAEIGREDE